MLLKLLQALGLRLATATTPTKLLTRQKHPHSPLDRVLPSQVQRTFLLATTQRPQRKLVQRQQPPVVRRNLLRVLLSEEIRAQNPLQLRRLPLGQLQTKSKINLRFRSVLRTHRVKMEVCRRKKEERKKIMRK